MLKQEQRDLETALGAKPRSDISDDNLRAHFYDARDHTYQQLAERGLPLDQVHRMQVCAEAADLMVGYLVSVGINAHRENHSTGDSGSGQNYAVVEKNDGSEWIGDVTWQLHVDPKNVTARTPKALIGPRHEVLAIARDHGLAGSKLSIWQAHTRRIDPKDQRKADEEAAEAADRAEKNGEWANFAAISNKKPRRFGRRAA